MSHGLRSRVLQIILIELYEKRHVNIAVDAVGTCSWPCDYTSEKIHSAVVAMEPFPHIEVRKLFSDDDFWKFCESPEIKIEAANTDEDVLQS